jgi:DNA (cytosine-5)-methyltransferase 1
MKGFKFIDLFCGLGGFRIAMEKLGGQCVFSCDNDLDVCKVYEKNFYENPFGDITKISEKEIPKHDVLCAGFPCQPFSIAGKRKGFNDTRGTLFFDVARIIKHTKPKIVFLENVAGITSHDSGKTIKVITSTLEELGYEVHTKVMNAKDYGIPQNRNRWYCVAIRKDIYYKPFLFPKKCKLKYTIEDIIEPKEIKEYAATTVALNNINKFLENFKKSQRYYGENRYIIANEIRPSRCSFRNDGISPCLTAKMGTGGNNIPVIVQYKRKLTEKECLRIMGFPENYKIKKNNMQSYKQIGNSVVIPIIYAIGERFIEYL